MSSIADALDLAHYLGRPDLEIAILAEGNVSARIDDHSFWIKASGTEMANLEAHDLVQVRFERILEAIDGPGADDLRIRSILTESVQGGSESMPSVETFMHAYLLSLPGVTFVGHGHPASLLSLLCTEDAERMARERIFPDEIVCCGPTSAFVPYTDPGLALAQSIRRSVEAYSDEFGILPRTIWLANHGLIAIGETVAEVRNAFAMSVKAARVRLGALASGSPIRALTQEQVQRLHSRPDEHYRQALLRRMRAVGSMAAEDLTHIETATIAPHG